ncbi:MAG TPA: plastocyanin/azurin family copper-binding protein [Acidimicrobiales bacterium]|nr:plastocyanin/azurin family copper-binding protein [Acidimicrobiales bacterium]
MKRLVLISAVLAAGLLPGACSSTEQAAPAGPGAEHDDHGGAAPTIPGAPTLEVEATSFAYDPPSLQIDAGQPVNIVLASAGILHDLTVEEADFHLSAGGGETVGGSLVIDEPGTYTGFCSVPGHRNAGMEIAIVVR